MGMTQEPRVIGDNIKGLMLNFLAIASQMGSVSGTHLARADVDGTQPFVFLIPTQCAHGGIIMFLNAKLVCL